MNPPFVVDIVTTYILEKSEDILNNSLFNKIYHDNGIDIKMTKLSANDICDWLEKIQTRVNQLTKSKFF